MISTITGTVTTSVTPGHGNYAAALTIAKSGIIDSQPDAVSAEAFGVDLTNLGNIDGNVSFYLENVLNNAGVIAGITAVSCTFNDTAKNTGQIIGVNVGIALGQDGNVSNSGLIQAGYLGIYGSDGGYVLNSGTVLQTGAADGAVSAGVDLSDAIINNKGSISGFYGVVAQNDSSVYNSGTILGLNIGVDGSGALISNSGSIDGDFAGIKITSGIATNSGNIRSIAYGIEATGNAAVVNSGSLYGESAAIWLQEGGNVTNAGTITGGAFAIHDLSSNLALSLTVEAGARFTGLVEDQTGHGTLLLGGTATGSLDMASSFVGFSQIAFEPGVKWTLEGSTLDLAGGQVITGFGHDTTIALDSFAATSDSFVSGTGLVLANRLGTETLDIAGSFTTSDFVVSDVAGGTRVERAAPCFCAGSRIATAHGNIAVESLQIGDLVKTAAHGLQPIIWIGRRAYDGRFIAGNHLALPVRIRRHAFGFNVPSRDLYVSPDHALCEGGVLVHAWRFVNGVSITQAQSVERVEYYHIELDRHAVIFAENTPVESFLDTGCRDRFQNAQSAPPTMPQAPCLPRVEDGYYLARLKARIDARAGIAPAPGVTGPLRGNIDEAGPVLSGWAQDEAAPEMPVELELVCGGQVARRFLANRYRADLRKAGLGSGCHAFEMALPFEGSFMLRRVKDGAVLGEMIKKKAAAF